MSTLTPEMDVTVTHETLTNDPHATDTLTCVICNCQRDRAVAAGWRHLCINGQSFFVCEHELPSVYENPREFKERMLFSIFCALNVIKKSEGLPTVPEVEALRQKVRKERKLL